MSMDLDDMSSPVNRIFSKTKEHIEIPRDAPEGFQYKERTVWGMRKTHPGLLEIKIHFPPRKNAVNGESMLLVANIINEAQKDKNVKCIMLHGGRFFSSGNDLMAFKDFAFMS